MADGGEERRKKAASFRRIADASSIGLAFPIAIAIGYLWGRALDSFLHTEPWCAYIFAGFGIVAGFLNAFRIAAQVGKEEDRAADAGKDAANDDEDGR